MTTIFEHDGKELFKDEADEYGTVAENIEAIRQHYAQFDKTLLTATYTVAKPEKEGDPTKVIFAKKIGHKGAGATAPLVVAAILATPPADIKALAYLDEFLASGPDGLPEPVYLQLMAGELEQAVHQAEDLSERSAEVVKLCLQLRPIAAPAVPLGF